MALIDQPYLLALYGSRARGDHDELSDIDTLSIGGANISLPDQEADPRLCLSHYSWPEFEAMHSYGSLFLQHLKRESVPYKYNDCGLAKFKKLMLTLPAYGRTQRDIQSFRLALSDSKRAIESGDTTFEFELSSIATTVRHSSILGCYLIGRPTFGRYEAVSTFCGNVGLPREISQGFVRLYTFRMAVERNAEMPILDNPSSYIDKWLSWSADIVEEVAKCCERNNASSV